MFARKTVLTALAAWLAASVAGCGHVPVSTMARLRSFDALRFDPAQLRIAAQGPEWLKARPGGAHFKLTLRRGAETRVESFALQEMPEGDAGLSAFARPGARIDAYRLSDGDAARVRALQGAYQEPREGKSSATMAVDIDACRTRDLPAGPILGSTHIRVDAAQGWMTLLSNLDIRKVAQEAGETLETRLPPCAT